jgi:hypothetical protein
MLLVDDLLAAPFRGLMFVFAEIARAVDEEREAQHRQIIANLAELHRLLDEGRLAVEEFDARETALLDQLAAAGG